MFADCKILLQSEIEDVGASGKGVFSTSELYWELPEAILRFGIWSRSVDHQRFDDSGECEINHGLYGGANVLLDRGNWNLRLGMANEVVPEVSSFVALAFQHPQAIAPVRIGLTNTGMSHHLMERSDSRCHMEDSVRFDLNKVPQLTSSLQ